MLGSSLRHQLLLPLKDQPLSSIRINQHAGLCPFRKCCRVLPPHIHHCWGRPSAPAASALFQSHHLPVTHGGIYCLFLLLKSCSDFKPLPVMKMSHILVRPAHPPFVIVRKHKKWPKTSSCITAVKPLCSIKKR